MKTFVCRARACFRAGFALAATLAASIPLQAAGSLVAGDGFAAAVTDEGTLVTWGRNESFQLGHSSSVSPVSIPQAVALAGDSSSWEKVSVGNDFTLGLGTDGILYSWGNNANGQLGTGSSLSAVGIPSPVALPAGSVVRDFVSGQGHAYALVDIPGESGVLYAWGSNSFGQLGQGGLDRSNRSTPVRVNLRLGEATSGIRAIGASDSSGFAIASDGSLWSWGSNTRGELGRGKKITFTNLSTAQPAQIGKSKKWESVVGGARHVLALNSGKIYAWGDNTFAQCARSSTKSPVVLAPTALGLPRKAGTPKLVIAGLAAGDSHSLALTTSGLVYGWGFNIRGELGRVPATKGSNKLSTPFLIDLDDPTKSDPKKRIPLPLIDAIAAGGDFSVLSTRQGTLLSYGANNRGQLGAGYTSENRDQAGLPIEALVGLPNLSVAAPSPVSEAGSSGGLSFGVGSTFGNLSLVVRNSGSVSTDGSYRVAFYLSADGQLDTTDRLLAEKVENATLGSGVSRATAFSAAELAVPELSPGSYFLLAQVYRLDASGAPIPDIYTPDNGAATAVTLVGPDLTTTGVVTLANTLVEDGDAGFGSVSLTLANVNIGKVAGGRVVEIDAYLSADEILQPGSDILLKNFEFTLPAGGLPGGARIAVDLGTIPVPSGVDGGDYRLLFAINRDGTIAETGTAANFQFIAVRVAAHDLSVTSPVLPEGPLGEGSVLPLVSVLAQNLGTRAYTGSYTVGLYASESAVFDFNAVELAEPIMISGGLAEQSSKQVVWQNVELPITLKGAVYFFSRVVADPSLGDRFPANNQASISAELFPPSFAFSDFVFPNTTSVETGGSLGGVSYKLENNGPGALQSGFPVAVEIFLSTDGDLDRGTDVLLDQYPFVDGLAPGASVILPSPGRELSIPSGVANGTYSLIFAFNADNSQSFLPSTQATVPVNVGALDVRIAAPVLTNLQLGTSSVVPLIGVAVENLGGFAVPAGLTVELYLSTNATFDAADGSPLARLTLSDPLPATESQAISFSDVTIPDRGQGTFYFLARLVLPAGLVDTNNANNLSATEVTLSRPSVIIENLITPVELDLDVPEPTLVGISFDLVNTSAGVVTPGTPLVYELYLSRDDKFDVTDRLLGSPATYAGGLLGSTDAAESRYEVPAYDVQIEGDLVGGTYQLLFIVNREGKAALASVDPLVVAHPILFQKTNAPGRALDYGYTTFSSTSATADWSVVSDPRATSGSAYESPQLEAGESASIQFLVTGPTELNVPWKLIADSSDAVELTVTPTGNANAPATLISDLPALDPNTGQSVFDPVFRLPSRQTYVVDPQTGALGYSYSPAVVPDGEHLVTWTYLQNSNELGNFTRIDLDLPSFVTSGTGDWFGVTSNEAKVGGNYARSPTLATGQQAALEVTVVGPALVSFWWRCVGDEGADTLAFYIDDELAELPTYDFETQARPAVISNQAEWTKVSFLVRGGPRKLRWVFSQLSENPDAQANVDGLSVLNPVPDSTSPNRNDDAATYGDVPASTVDLAITAASAPTGTYLLDDARGSSRLPLRVTFANVGRSYSSEPTWDASALEVRLSTDNVWGNDNDFIIGNYARFDVLRVGHEVTFDVEINLSFDIPEGVYYILTRVRGYGAASQSDGEFTLANNTRVLGNSGAGNAYIIRRAPDLRITGLLPLEENYPYHPEDAVYITYTIGNLGLGPVRPDQPFKVNVSLYALGQGGTDLAAGVLIRSYGDREFRLFLPQASAAYPNGASQTVTQFIDLPSEFEILVALGLVDGALPEDDARVYQQREGLRNSYYYFVFEVDPDNSVVESSETNTFRSGSFFQVVPIRRSADYGFFVENAGSFYGDAAFSDFMNLNSSDFSTVTFDTVTNPRVPLGFTDYIWKYALYEAPFGSPNLLFQQEQQNSTMRLDVPPYVNDDDASNDIFQTISFDFNVQASDVEVAVQARDDVNDWETIYTLRPPYTDIFGPRSLNGYGGLSSSPYVVSLDGNVTAVQKVHAARITFRDRIPVAARGGLANNPQMRLVVTPAPGVVVPATPTDFRASVVDGSVILNWAGSLPVKFIDFLGVSYPVTQGAYVVERARDGVNFETLGVVDDSNIFSGQTNFRFTDTSPGTRGTNTYRVRGFTSAGVSAPNQVSILVDP